jgi:hypothetical protein
MGEGRNRLLAVGRSFLPAPATCAGRPMVEGLGHCSRRSMEGLGHCSRRSGVLLVEKGIVRQDRWRRREG